MKRHKQRRIPKVFFFVVAFLVIALTCAAFFGVENYHGDIRQLYVKGASDIRWGTDIRGGVEAMFSPDIDDAEITKENMDSAREIIETRLLYNNITDSEVFVDYESHKIIVQFPWQSDEEDYDPAAAVDELGEMAQLAFYHGEEKTGEPFMLGEHVVSAQGVFQQGDGTSRADGFVVALKFDEKGKDLFYQATKQAAANNTVISIYLDDACISVASCEEPIDKGEAVITSDKSNPFTQEDVEKLADQINAGSLPFALTVDKDKLEVISPTLGEEALKVMLIAGAAAFLIICILMVVLYKVPGLVACIALIGQVGGMIACVSGFFPNTDSFTLTIPGIAGIVLSIGFGVDANVISAERIKEEFAKGKTIDGAITAGFENAWSSIFDSNITNIIVSIVLLAAFGTPDSLLARVFNFLLPFLSASATGAIYSFGYTLLTGVIFNFIMGVLASRIMLLSISRFKFLRKPQFYGGAKSDE